MEGVSFRGRVLMADFAEGVDQAPASACSELLVARIEILVDDGQDVARRDDAKLRRPDDKTTSPVVGWYELALQLLQPLFQRQKPVSEIAQRLCRHFSYIDAACMPPFQHELATEA